MWLLFTGRHVVSLGGLCSAGGAFKLAPQCEPVKQAADRSSHRYRLLLTTLWQRLLLDIISSSTVNAECTLLYLLLHLFHSVTILPKAATGHWRLQHITLAAGGVCASKFPPTLAAHRMHAAFTRKQFASHANVKGQVTSCESMHARQRTGSPCQTLHTVISSPYLGAKEGSCWRKGSAKATKNWCFLVQMFCCSSGKSPNTRAPRSPATQRDAP